MSASTPRIVSLLPGCTEMVIALGARNHLVGRSHECDHPVDLQNIPVCSSPHIDIGPGESSRGIDQAVQDRLQSALSIYQVDLAKLKELQPDLILTQDQCAACAISLADVEEALRQWEGKAPRALSFSPKQLPDLWEDFARLADALGIPDHGKEVVRKLKSRCVDVIQKSCEIKKRPSTACIEWIDPLMAAGNWIPEMVELAGGRNLFGQAGQHSPRLEWKSLQEHNPDVIVVMPCGFDRQRTRNEMSGLTRQPGWANLRAVRHGNVYLTDGQHYFNRPGPRLVDSLEALAEMLHPTKFQFGHEGTVWEPL